VSVPSYDAWVLARIMSGQAIDGEVAGVSDGLRTLAEGLATAREEDRLAILEGFTLNAGAPDDLSRAIVDADPLGPPPAAEAGQSRRRATLADVRRLVADASWPWKGWLAGGVLNSLAADPGIGKTLLAMTLARTLWTGAPWPDGQPNPFPAGTPTLWVPGDHHYNQLLELAAQYGLPDEAILLAADAEAPTGGQDLDDEAVLAALDQQIRAEAPGLVIIDTIIGTTGRNLGKPEESRAYFGPLMTIAVQTNTSFLLLTHLSKEGQALGRRIIGASRVVWKLTHPDPEGHPDRRKFWVDKSYIQRPPALGMTIGDSGCTFDLEPPSPPEAKPARGAAKLEACKQWLTEHLTPNPAPVKDIREEAEKSGFYAATLYIAHEQLGLDEYIVDRRKWWKLPAASDSLAAV
jgi:hypothetical protein